MSDDEANIPKYSKYGRHHLEDISHNNHDKTKLRLTPSGRDLSCVSQRQFHLIGSATKFSRSETSTSPLRQDVPRDIKCLYFPLRSAAPATCHDLLTKASSSAVSFFELENWKRSGTTSVKGNPPRCQCMPAHSSTESQEECRPKDPRLSCSALGWS